MDEQHPGPVRSSHQLFRGHLEDLGIGLQQLWCEQVHDTEAIS